MKFLARGSVLRWAVANFLLACAWLTHGQPVNDLIANRVILSGDVINLEASNVSASLEAGEPEEIVNSSGASVWWEWTAVASQRVTVSTAGSDFDTVVGVFTQDSLGDLKLVALNDDEDLLAGIFSSRVSFPARNGTRYQIAVAGVPDGTDGFATGTIRLQVSPAALAPLAAWEVTTLDGELLKSSDLSARLLIVDFWATWCAPCRAEIPSFIEMQQRYGPAGLQVLGVSVDTVGIPAVQAFASELKINYPLAMTTPALERALGGVPSIPTAFILDAENNLVARRVGFREHSFWEAEVKALLDTEPARPALQAAHEMDQIRLTWPVTSLRWALESAPALNGPWNRVPDLPKIDRDRAAVTLPFTNMPSQFFRLTQP